MMKKFLSFFLIITILASCFTGCDEKRKPDVTDDIAPQTSGEKEIITGSNYLYGRITEKISPDILVLELETSFFYEQWGKIVHVVTEDVDGYCVGDEVCVTFSVAERFQDMSQCVKIIADKVTSDPGEFVDKPTIYLYPEEPTVCSVKVSLNGKLTCTYPEHKTDGWEGFTAFPDGTLIFPDGKEYYALYWEGIQFANWDFTKGFCVRGEDTAEFLEWALEKQGLTRREANEFIVYWLPLMQENPYNVISFQTTAYTDGASLDITPTPDCLLRVFMAYYPTDAEVEIEPQTFAGFTRQGFAVVEWGGSKVTKP